MPLYPNGEHQIRKNLGKVSKGITPYPVKVGRLTDVQLAELNNERSNRKMKPMKAEIVFVGKHMYERRVLVDGYSIDDVIEQIMSALDEKSVVRMSPKMTAIQSSRLRNDGYGNQVLDEAVLECTMKYPKPELYSVIPKGDNIKPRKPVSGGNKPQ